MRKERSRKVLERGTRVVVIGDRRGYGNAVGKATVVDPDYRGFPGRKGVLVLFDRTKLPGFVAVRDTIVLPTVKGMDPEKMEPTVEVGRRYGMPMPMNTAIEYRRNTNMENLAIDDETLNQAINLLRH